MDARKVERLGVLDEIPTITHYHVTPCVGLLPRDVSFVPARDEVEEVFALPLSLLSDPSIYRSMRSPKAQYRHQIDTYLTEPHIVWGATGAMVTNFLRVLGGL